MTYRVERPGVRDSERESFRLLDRLGITSAVEVLDVAVGTSDTKVAHGLGRRPKAWVIMDQAEDATVWRTEPSDSSFLTLRASADTVISLLVW